MKRFFQTLTLASLLLLPQIASAAPLPNGKSGELYDTIKAQDAAVFDAFNHCDIAKLGTYFADNVEFYHDHDGLSTGKAAFLDAVQKNVCGKFTRVLVPSSLEVYPLPGYGALEIGIHQFHHADPASPTGQGQFVHIWQKQADGHWQLTRVISYNHGEAPR
jgi:ketosteroid isomerase-like protein